MRSRPMSRALVALVACLALATLAPVPALADGPLRVTLRLGSRCLTGNKPTMEPVTVRLLRHDGTTIETRRDDTTDSAWSVCFARHTPVAGNKIRLVQGDLQRTVRVPDLTIALDRATNVVSGRGPAGATIELLHAACTVDGSCIAPTPVMVNVNGNGRYRRDLSTDIDGSDTVRATYKVSAHVFYRTARAPYMTITAPDRVSLTCMPAGTTTVRLLSSTGALRAIKTVHIGSRCGSASGSFRKNGHAVNIHKGDRIRADFASDARFAWPSVSTSASEYTYSVRCFPNADWDLTIRDKGSAIAHYGGMTDADGRFSILGYALIPSGATLRAECESTRGDRVVATGTAS